MLNEAKQDEINFSNVFGDDLLARFKALKQNNRLSGSESDFYHWIRKSKEDLDGTIDELDKLLSKLENKVSRSARSKLASEGAEVVYEDDEWIVLLIKTYAAAVKYGAGTTWCITGRYRGAEESGEYYFNSYKARNGWDYYFYIKKDGRDLEGRQEKWCLCYGGDDNWCVWNAEDDNISEEGYGIPDAPQVPGLPDVSGAGPDYDYDREDDGHWGDEEEDEDVEEAPREPAAFVNIPVDDPNDYEFSARSKEEAASKFKDDAEVVETLREPDLHIVKWHEEPEQRAEGEEGPEDTGDRYSLFVFFPGEGGGPLLAQTGNGFALQVFRNLDKIREFAGRMPGVEIRNNRQDTEDMPECLKENFYYYNDNSWFYDL
jgi:hypothetical protein